MATKLMTKAIETLIEKHPIYSQDGKGGDAKILAKFFFGNMTWYVLEGRKIEINGDYEFFGIVRNDAYEEAEYGYFNLSQLMSVKFWGVPCVERDRYFESCKVKDCDELARMLNY